MGGRLKGKVAIVTGAGTILETVSGMERLNIGGATAMVFARAGAKVFVMDVNGEQAEETQRLIQEEGFECISFQGDVSKPEDCWNLVKECIKIFGRIDVLQNNAAIPGRRFARPLEVREEDWDQVMNINLKGMVLTSQAVVPYMLDQGSGAILNVSSISAVKIHLWPDLFIYNISKAGVNILTRSLAMELADKGIRVNGIMPGMMDTMSNYKLATEFYGSNIDTIRAQRAQLTPMKRLGEIWDIAQASLFLVSDEAKYITGQILAVDGGLCA